MEDGRSRRLATSIFHLRSSIVRSLTETATEGTDDLRGLDRRFARINPWRNRSHEDGCERNLERWEFGARGPSQHVGNDRGLGRRRGPDFDRAFLDVDDPVRGDLETQIGLPLLAAVPTPRRGGEDLHNE